MPRELEDLRNSPASRFTSRFIFGSSLTRRVCEEVCVPVFGDACLGLVERPKIKQGLDIPGTRLELVRPKAAGF
jgi:hypothetical protein